MDDKNYKKGNRKKLLASDIKMCSITKWLHLKYQHV